MKHSNSLVTYNIKNVSETQTSYVDVLQLGVLFFTVFCMQINFSVAIHA